MNYFVTAIGTDSGKTVVSAILIEALKADYWKPVQAGYPTDSTVIKELLPNANITFHRERYLLNTPASPHAAAKIDHVEINLNDFKVPETKRNLVIEGAGGLMVPLNDKDMVHDLIPVCKAEVILVANLYLGSINHTLLSINLLKQKGYKVKGIIFNGEENIESERIILEQSGYLCLLRIRPEAQVDHNMIRTYADKIAGKLI
ncbi:dethiobiotin synthase [Fulvivirgaceae bacterium BMA10]|uniref:ATP-dependent dethiobiotin synthetase BioD n=1 Tax=Splendidivirga corallicola TaxID=3051826 RepID=A0ABT8KGP2_9BACT|nr:dethiobiotin synthase [Fulvivirgaceae bacterium BMA10]